MVAGFASERRPASNRNPRPASSEYAENRKLKQLVADLSLDKHILQDVLAKKL